MTASMLLSPLLLLLFLSHRATGLVHDKCPLKVPSSIRTSPLIIAHRGASFHLPEHTLEAYRLALELGTDYIEPDLVSSKDGTLVVVHSVDLNLTTNVMEVFPNKTTFSQHHNETGYWVYDFDVSELKQLRVKQRLPTARSTKYDGKFEIPTLDEVLELLHEFNTQALPQFYTSPPRTDNTTIEEPLLLPRAGLYAELKDPERHLLEANLNLVDIFLQTLDKSPFAGHMWNDTACDALKFNQYLVPPLVVQCFDETTLQQVHTTWIDTYNHSLPPPMVLLLHGSECPSSGSENEESFWYRVEESKGFLNGLGPPKECLFPLKNAEEFQRRALEHQMAVHPWTERPESVEFLHEGSPKEPVFGSLQEELRYLFCEAKVDGLFSEDVSTAVRVARTSCDDEASPTAAPTAVATAPPPSGDAIQCPELGNEETHTREELFLFGFAAGVMGLLVGSIATIWISNSSYCRRRTNRRLQLAVPQHDLEMI